MSKKLSFATASLALALSFAPGSFAQDMGGGDKPEAKPEEPKGDKPDAPKPDAPKPADAPKADEPKTKKSVVFDASPEAWKIVASAHGPVLKALYNVDEGPDGAQVAVIYAGAKASYDKELERWMTGAETADGKKLEKSAVKEDSFEANGLKVKTAEFGASMPAVAGKKAKKDEKVEKKAGQKLIAAYVDGPDGAWVVRLQGAEKTVDKAREDFLKFVKSAKPGERPAEEKKEKKKKEPKE